MNIYLFIAAFGLILKLVVSYRELLYPSSQNSSLRPELLIFIFVFIGYSLTQILVFTPQAWLEAFNIDHSLAVRFYYMFDGLGLLSGGYLLLSMLDAKVHRTIWVKLIIFAYVLLGGYFLLFTEAFISHQLLGEDRGPLGLGGGYGGDYVLIPRLVVLASLVAISVGIYRSYFAARANEMQIKSLYALMAGFIYALNCLLGLYKMLPMIIALRGIIFFVVVLIILRKQTFFDIRLSWPTTLENNAVRRFHDVFRDYASENVGHRDALKQIEKLMVEYKISKVSGFKDDPGSALPLAAESMNISLSSMYDLLKKMDIDRPDKK